jgi:hypothetical protein
MRFFTIATRAAHLVLDRVSPQSFFGRGTPADTVQPPNFQTLTMNRFAS